MCYNQIITVKWGSPPPKSPSTIPPTHHPRTITPPDSSSLGLCWVSLSLSLTCPNYLPITILSPPKHLEIEPRLILSFLLDESITRLLNQHSSHLLAHLFQERIFRTRPNQSRWKSTTDSSTSIILCKDDTTSCKKDFLYWRARIVPLSINLTVKER